jgi:ABC-2 type transport system permease protein
MRKNLRAAFAIFQRDLRLYLSYRASAVTQLLSVVFSLALFYYVSRLLNLKTAFGSADDYFAFVVVGIVILAVTQSTLVLSQSMRGELVAGSFERILLSPFGPVRGALSMVLFPLMMSLFTGLWTMVVAASLFGLHLHWSTVPLAVPVGIAASLCFASISMMVAAIVVVFKQAPGVGALITLVALVSGYYFPPELLPGWISWASHVQPFTPAVELMRHYLVGLPTTDPIWNEVGRLIAFVVVLLPFSTWVLWRGVLLSQRKGTIVEY